MVALDSTAITTSLLGAIALIVSTLGVAVVSLKNSTKAHEEAKAGRELVTEQLQPKNGYDSLGQAIEAIEQQLSGISEAIAGQEDRLVVGDRLFVKMEDKLAEVLVLAAETRALAKVNAERLERHMLEVEPTLDIAKPLLSRATREWGKDGRAKEKKK